jgi:hypothetical protein
MEEDVIRWGCEYNLVSPDNTYVVELHWRVAPKSYAIDWEFSNSTSLRELAIQGQRFRTLAAEEDLLALCVHAAKHVWNTLIWITDIGLAMQQPLDWKRLGRLAAGSGTQRICATSFEFAKLLGYQIPTDAEALFADSKAMVLARILAKRLFTERHDTFTRVDRQMLLDSRERFRDRIAYRWWLGTAPDLYVSKSGMSGRFARFAKVMSGNTAS